MWQEWMVTGQAAVAVTIPRWIVREVIRIKNTPDYNPDNAAGRCERCGAALFAEIWKIEETGTGRIWVVGSTCVKALTGQTPGQLAAGFSAYGAACAEEQEEKEMQVIRTAFFAAHAAEMEFLDTHIERVHKAGEMLLQAWVDGGREIGKYPNTPSAEFWESLREQGRTKGAWTQAQVDAIKREMSVLHDAALPSKGAKDEFLGVIESARCFPGFSEGTFKVRIQARQQDGVILGIDAAQGTGFEKALQQATGNNEQPYMSTELCLEGLARLLAGKIIKVKGTVKGQAATGGKAYLTRAKLISLV